MKYLPTTFPHTHTPSLNPPSHYKLKSYFYFLPSSLSLHLNYVSLAEKNSNLSYFPKILAYIFFFPSVRPRVTLVLTIYCGSGSGKNGNAREHTKNVTHFSQEIHATCKISYQKTFHNQNQNRRISYITLSPFKCYHYSPFSFHFSAFFCDGNTLQKTVKGNTCRNRKITSQFGLYYPPTVLPLMVTILCFFTPMFIHLSSDYLILCKNVKLSPKT
jgi:hypothetical protein